MLKHDQLWQAMLPHVPFLGWTEACAEAALQDLGLPPATLSLYAPNGLLPLVMDYCRHHDDCLITMTAPLQLDKMRTTAKIALLVKERILLHAGEEEATRRALSFFMRPWYALKGVQALWRTADTIWHLAGDQAIDWNHYSKRTLLAYVYSTTLFFWLDDHSAAYEDSWQFLERRLHEVLTLGSSLRNLPQEVRILIKKIPFLRLLLPRSGAL